MTRRSTSALLSGAAALSLGLVTTPEALAYCRTAGCEEGVGAKCAPSQASDCGIELSWPSPCISYSLQADGTSLAPFDVVRTQMRQAFDAWQTADCGGAAPSFVVVETDTVACSKRDFDQDGGSNANLIVFRDADWPYSARGVLALTTVTYGLETGTIRDADMEINSAEVDFSFGDADVSYDFLSVVTHEAGHFLGLAHSPVAESTMRRDYKRGSTDLRSLDADDVAGICAVFPADEAVAAELDTCAPLPEGGLRGSCGDEGGGEDADGGATDDGCAVTPSGARAPRTRDAAWVLGCAGVLVAARGRRRARV